MRQEVGTCSEIGVDILMKGGNAVDGEFSCDAAGLASYSRIAADRVAMIASSLCVGTIAGYHSGIGGVSQSSLACLRVLR